MNEKKQPTEDEPKAPTKARKVTQRDAKLGEVRSLRVLNILQRAMNNVHVAIDVKAALHSVSAAARNYGAVVMEEGAITDAQAAKALGVKVAEVTAAADELDAALSGR